jgi:hypothetical protein
MSVTPETRQVIKDVENDLATRRRMSRDRVGLAGARLIEKLWYRRVLWVLRALLLITAAVVLMGGEVNPVEIVIGTVIWWFAVQGLLWLVVKGVMPFPQRGVGDPPTSPSEPPSHRSER